MTISNNNTQLDFPRCEYSIPARITWFRAAHWFLFLGFTVLLLWLNPPLLTVFILVVSTALILSVLRKETINRLSKHMAVDKATLIGNLMPPIFLVTFILVASLGVGVVIPLGVNAFVEAFEKFKSLDLQNNESLKQFGLHAFFVEAVKVDVSGLITSSGLSLGKGFSVIKSIVNSLEITFFTIALALPLTYKSDKVIMYLKDWLHISTPNHWNSVVDNMIVEIAAKLRDTVFTQAIVGMMMSVIMTFLFLTSAWLAGEPWDIPYAIAMGVTIGMMSIIPFLGAVLGTFLAFFVTLITFGMDSQAVLINAGLTAFVVVLLNTLFEAKFLTPRLMGERTGSDSTYVLTMVVICGFTFGLLGLFVAYYAAAITQSLISVLMNLCRAYAKEEQDFINSQKKRKKRHE